MDMKPQVYIRPDTELYTEILNYVRTKLTDDSPQEDTITYGYMLNYIVSKSSVDLLAIKQQHIPNKKISFSGVIQIDVDSKFFIQEAGIKILIQSPEALDRLGIASSITTGNLYIVSSLEEAVQIADFYLQHPTLITLGLDLTSDEDKIELTPYDDNQDYFNFN